MTDTAANDLHVRCSGREFTVPLDVTRWMGDMLEELEDHLGGEPVLAWAQRMGTAMSRGVRVRDLRSRDIIALVYLGWADAEPGVTWQDVARSIAPYTLEIIEDAPAPAPPAEQWAAPVTVMPDVSMLG